MHPPTGVGRRKYSRGGGTGKENQPGKENQRVGRRKPMRIYDLAEAARMGNSARRETRTGGWKDSARAIARLVKTANGKEVDTVKDMASGTT